jgi:uncharacterized membrane protein YGL010W
MSALVSCLSKYAAYHRDARNIATHMVGIPAIVIAIEVLASRPALQVGELAVTPAMALAAMAAAFYLRLDLRFGVVMAALLALAAWLGLVIAALPTPTWLAVGVGLFAGGWAFQFVGHHYEGRKPAFLDDITSLIIGPLFVAAEVAFRAGFRKALALAVDEAARPGGRSG